MDQLESDSKRWRKCVRRCPWTSRRFRTCRSNHSRTRPARRSDGGSSATSSPLSNRCRPLSTWKNGHDFNDDSNATAFSVIINNFWLIDFVLCSKTTTSRFRATHLIQAFYYFGFTLLYSILQVISTMLKQQLHSNYSPSTP